MRNINEAEALREALNRQLDSENELRNALGQFSTPNRLAQAIVRETTKMFGQGRVLSVLEPCCGSGSFISALLAAWNNKIKILGIDIDSNYLNIAQKCFGNNAILLNEDYLFWEEGSKFDLIISNPPYVRHHAIDKATKTQLPKAFKAKGIKFSGLSDLYCYFMVKAIDELKQDGIMCWLIPEEFLSVNYGYAIRLYFLERFTIKRIHVFAAEDTKFDDALVSSCVVWIQNKASCETDETLFTYGPDIEHPIKEERIQKEDLRQQKKWGVEQNSQGEVRLSDLFKIKRGIATGANDFFIIPKSANVFFQIPEQFLTPILPSARYVKTNHITADKTGFPSNTDCSFLIDCHLQEEEVEEKYPSLWAYLQTGINLKEESYICKNRKVWYWQDHREPPLFLLTYMGRGSKKSDSPFRFILNDSLAIANNSFLMLYPTELLIEKMRSGTISKEQMLELLNGMPPQTLINGGRQYGGGLKKIEPKELGQIRIDI